MNVKEFCDEMQKIKIQKDRESYLSQRINVKYVPYETKMARCEQIVNICSYITVEDHKVYRVNTPMQYIFTTLTLVNEYTDIDIDFTDGGFLNDFNLLAENDLVEDIISVVPVREYETWMTLIKMINADKQENERSIVAYLDTKFEAISNVLSTTIDTFNSLVEQNEEEDIVD